MKFVVKPGILTGGNHAKDNAKMRKHQDHFLQNISKMEVLTPITSSLDTIVKIKPGKNRTLYTLRQMLMMVKNPDPDTNDAVPYLFYDVDRVGSSQDIRFVHFKILTEQVIRAAGNILALLQRNFSSAYDFEEHFTLDAIVEARKHPWSKDHGGYAQGKPKSGIADPKTMLIMCKNNNSDASSCSEYDTSDGNEDEDEEEEERSRGYLPKSVRNQALPRRSILREDLRYKGLHPPGPAGTEEQEKPFKSAKDEDLDAQSTGAKTRVPIDEDDHSLGNSTIQTTHTMAPMKQVSFHGTDNEKLQLDLCEDDNKTVAPSPDSVREIIDVEDDGDSLPSASGLTMATVESQGIDFDVEDDDGATTQTVSMPLETMTIESNDDMSVLTGNTQGTIGLVNNRPLKRPHEVMKEEEASMASARTKTSKTSDNSSPSLESNKIEASDEDSPMTDHQDINDKPRQDSNNEGADGASG